MPGPPLLEAAVAPGVAGAPGPMARGDSVDNAAPAPPSPNLLRLLQGYSFRRLGSGWTNQQG